MIDAKELKIITQNLNVLYVEDDLEVQNNTKKLLENLFREVAVANNGRDALDIYKIKSFDIIFTDINMPKMNGVELVINIKNININQSIVVISGHNEKEFLEGEIQHKIDHYLFKPIGYEELLDTLFKVSKIVKDRKEKYNKI